MARGNSDMPGSAGERQPSGAAGHGSWESYLDRLLRAIRTDHDTAQRFGVSRGLTGKVVLTLALKEGGLESPVGCSIETKRAI